MKTTSLELSRRLSTKVPIETENCWVDGELWDSTMQSDYETPSTPPRSEWIPAYTTDELMEWLPIRNKYWKIPEKFSNDWWLRIEQCFVDGQKGYMVNYYGDSNDIKVLDDDIRSNFLPEALGLLAEYLVDNGIYKGKE